jgi:hypothetical protein
MTPVWHLDMGYAALHAVRTYALLDRQLTATGLQQLSLAVRCGRLDAARTHFCEAQPELQSTAPTWQQTQLQAYASTCKLLARCLVS